MGSLTGLNTFQADLMAPDRFTIDVPGNAIDGGRNGVGENLSIEMSGGGALVATFEDCKIRDPEQFEYVNWLGARMNGGFRFINVPIINDWWGPFPTVDGVRVPFVAAMPRSDGTMFTEDDGFSIGSAYGQVTAAAAVNAGTIKFRMFGGARDIRWSDWFSIKHPNKGWRAYRNWDVVSKNDDDNPVYELSITPPLREAVTIGERVEIARPRFVAKFRQGFTLPSIVESFFVVKQSIQFAEAF